MLSTSVMMLEATFRMVVLLMLLRWPNNKGYNSVERVKDAGTTGSPVFTEHFSRTLQMFGRVPC